MENREKIEVCSNNLFEKCMSQIDKEIRMTLIT